MQRGDAQVLGLLRHMALCNTVIPSPAPFPASAGGHAPRGVVYASSSPDEECIVTAAAGLGVQLQERGKDFLLITVNGVAERYELLQVLEFTSERKRMSVLLRTPAGALVLLCKGADEPLLRRCAGPAALALACSFFVEAYGKLGLRTLCFASRAVSQAEYAEWCALHKAASEDMGGGGGAGGAGRKARLADAYERLEQGLSVVGVTGVEDRLQEHVEVTIDKLRQAGVRVWMLTGDRRETALEISRACGLVAPEDAPLEIKGASREELAAEIQAALAALGLDEGVGAGAGSGEGAGAGTSTGTGAGTGAQPLFPYNLIVEGSVLLACLALFESDFRLLSLAANSVVCWRVTPADKAALVRLVRGAGKVALAIGDGGNDVAMIQAADVGVGISGREGQQAARAADYSISRFFYLTRLLLVHGRYSYNRSSVIAQYSFHKSCFVCVIQLSYAAFSAFSGASLLDAFSLMCYNTFYTGFPILFYCLEKDVSERLLEANPGLYETCRRGSGYTAATAARWLGSAAAMGAAVLLVAANTEHGAAALPLGAWEQSSSALVVFTAVVLVQVAVVLLETTYFTAYNLGAALLALVLFFLLNALLALVVQVSLYHVFFTLCVDPVYWLRVAVSCGFFCL